jgi:glycerol-3-phosphate dehydrogenase (NAD(P)+)
MWSHSPAEAENMNKNRKSEFLPGAELPGALYVTTDAAEAAEGAEFFVNAAPSKFTRSALERFAPFLAGARAVITVSKGLEERTLSRLSEVISEIAPEARVAALTGPSHAEEVVRRIPTACVSASAYPEAARDAQNLFMNQDFRIYTTGDIIGAELGGALKNVIAVAAGISDGLGYGDNTKAALMTRGIAEIARLGCAMGAKHETFGGLAGIGDLIVTCTSMHSRNRRAGILLGRGKTLDETLGEVRMVVEGVDTARAALLLAEKHGVSMPITKEVNEVLFNAKEPRRAVLDLMLRDKTTETRQ